MSFSRILLALSVIFALSFVASAAPITLPSLEDLQNRNPQDYYQYNSGRGNYENYSQTRLTTPTSSTERFSGNLGNWNYSNSRGYSITPDWFSISGGDYNWNSFNDWQGEVNTYSMPDGWMQFSYGGGSGQWYEDAETMNLFSDYSTVWISGSVIDNSGSNNYQYNSGTIQLPGYQSNWYNNSSSNSESRFQSNEFRMASYGNFVTKFYGVGSDGCPSGVPEPGTWGMFALGIAGVVAGKLRPKRTRAQLPSHSHKY